MRFEKTLRGAAAIAVWVMISQIAVAEEMPEGKEAKEGIEEIVVIGHPLSGEGLSQASDVLVGEELSRKLSANIGETLATLPGIRSAQFGNAVGRPVIHGLGGPRVRIMEDRIDVLDVSVTSADHAVAIEPFIAERIEVLKGPSTLLYGSGAIGGVVDVHTGRIPHSVPDKPISGGIETRFDDNTDGNTTAIKLNGGGGNFAWHLDGTWKDGDDYEIPGFAESARLRAAEEAEEEEEEGEEHHEEEEEARDILPGSEFDASSYAGGISYVFDGGFVGLAISEMDADYGLPGGHGHEEGHEEGEEEEEEHEEEEGNPVLELEQTRVDFELGLSDPFGNFSSLNVRLGINDYEHKELEPSGEVGSTFSKEAWELRTELVYDAQNWAGAIGLQHTDREFSAIGEEAFVPPLDTRDTGVFWVAERSFAGFDLETGLRFGQVDHDPEDGSSEDFTTFTGSLGFVIPLAEEWRLGLVADYSSRAPIAEELFSNGPHLVTNAFERGDPGLDNELAANLAATFQYQGEQWQGSLTAYVTQFSDFIYEQATGEIEDGLPVFQFQQDDAQFFGVDVELSGELAAWDGGALTGRIMADYVDAELDVSGNDNVPRIPPFRYGLGFELDVGLINASVDYIRVSEQDDVAANELVSDEYDDLRAYVGTSLPFNDGVSLDIFLVGKNLTDDEQRRHVSFIKEFAPAPGRTVELDLRLQF